MDIVKASFSLELIGNVQEGASAGSSALYSGVILVDEVAPTSSASSSSDWLLLSVPNGLIGGSEIHFGFFIQCYLD